MPAAAVKQRQNDPSTELKREILDRLGDLSGFEIAQNEVLLAIYQRPERTAGGIIQVPQTLKEDIYQGKVGLVVKIGDACEFQWTDTYAGEKGGIEIALHDWVVVRPSDTWPLDINTRTETLDKRDFVACRLVKPRNIRAKISHPGVVW